jgi:amino acid adenylation domain-containing protein
MEQHLFPLREVQAAYWAGRTSGLTLGNVAAYCYCEYTGQGLDSDRLERALQRLIQRHDALRLVIRDDGLQEVLRDTPVFRLIVNNLTALGVKGASRQLRHIRKRLSHQIRPLNQWPLFVAEVTALPSGESRFHFGFDLMMCDAASFRILLGDLARLYVDPDAVLSPILGTFRNYVLGEEELRRGDDYQQSRRYWLKQMDDLPAAPSLPHRVDPDKIASPRFVRVYRDVDRLRWSSIKAYAAHHRVTATAVVLALYGETLARYSGDSRLTLNLPVFNRSPIIPNVDELIGDFTSLVPIVIKIDKAATFVQRARRIQQQLWQALDNRIASDVVWRERSRQFGGTREGLLPYVFTSVLGLQEPAWTRAPEWPVEALPVEMSTQTPQVMCDFIVLESEGRLRWALHYVNELFHQETIDGIVNTFSVRLDALEHGESWEATAAAVLPDEAESFAPCVSREIRPEARLEQLFLESARRYPEHPAVITVNGTMSYRELERRSAALMRQIRRLGPSSGECLIAVVLPKGWEQVAAVLGIMRAGAAYVPVDPRLPASRISMLLRNSGVKVALTRSDVEPWMEWPTDVTRILVDQTEPLPNNDILDCPPLVSDSLAYVTYTSGSTGTPKGVMISHRGAVNTVLEINRLCEVAPTDRVLAVSSLSFDLSVYDMFGMLAAGGAVVMPDAGQELNLKHWLELIRCGTVTIWNSVPALLQLLLDGAAPEWSFSQLRIAMVSGDWVPLTLPHLLRQRAPEARFLAMGGATEASIWSIYKWVAEVEPGWSSIPYGRALPNQSVYVLDAQLESCPVWTPGEIYIGGLGVARGYLNDPERTAASFIVHSASSERLYRTGDFGRYLPDGEVEFLGRRDSQVKILGHRIELGEVESVLLKHPAVRQCAVIPTGEERRLSALIAYVAVSQEVARTTPDGLRLLAAAELPPHMVPREVVVLDQLPLTSNGKVDRRMLAEVARSTRPKPAYVEPRNSAELTVASFWMDVLRIERVGVHDDFFELGGDSLAATRIVSRINAAFGCSKSIRAIFDQPTISGLCSDLQTVPA